jgi:hypothetical protein
MQAKFAEYIVNSWGTSPSIRSRIGNRLEVGFELGVLGEDSFNGRRVWMVSIHNHDSASIVFQSDGL